MSKIQCCECNEYGHFKRNCPKLKKGNEKRKERNESHVIKEVEEPRNKEDKEGRSEKTLLLKGLSHTFTLFFSI